MTLTKSLSLTRPLILFDLETTSPEPTTARIVSLAMRVHRPDKSVQTYATLINPGIRIPKDASDVHGITDETIVTGCARCWQVQETHPHEHCKEFRPVPLFSQLADNLHRGFSSADFGGYNVRFDLRTITEEFARCKIAFNYGDAVVLDGLRLWQLLEPRSLEDAVEYWLKRKHKGAHSALTDIEETEDVIIAQLATGKLPRDLQKLHERQWPRRPGQIDGGGKFIFISGVACFNFGKHRGRPLHAHRDYLQWLFGQTWISTEVRTIVDAALSGKYPEP